MKREFWNLALLNFIGVSAYLWEASQYYATNETSYLSWIQRGNSFRDEDVSVPVVLHMKKRAMKFKRQKLEFSM